jgi:hypothetical protein
VKLTKLFKGQGLAKLLAKLNSRVLGINNLGSHKSQMDIEEIYDQAPIVQIEDNLSTSTWYHDIVTYLLNL